MENRFGVKDFFLLLFVSVLIVLVVLAMFQFDRQFDEIQYIKKQNSELTQDVVEIRRQLSQGIVAVGGSGGPTTQSTPPSMEYFADMVAAEKMPNFARGDWLVDNFAVKLGRLTPLISGDLYQRVVECQVLESLLARDPHTLELIPLLAESYKVNDFSDRWKTYTDPLRAQGLNEAQIKERLEKDPNAPVAMEVVFQLRKGVTFSDGSPLTSDDVLFTFEWIQNPEVNAPRDRAYLTTLKSVKASGPYEVSFSFVEPYFNNVEIAGGNVMSRKFYSRYRPAEYNEKTGLLFGSGPYKLEDPDNWTPGKPIVLVRNDRYWGVPGTFDRLVFREVEEESAEMVLFGNGELDYIECVPEQYDKLKSDPRVTAMSQHVEYQAPTNGYGYIGWNQKRKVGEQHVDTAFADKRVRQAMTLLADRERVTREVFRGYGQVASGPFDPNGPQSDPNIKPWPYDEARGKALLKEAGFEDRDGDNVIDAPDGRPFRFKLSYPSGSATADRMVLFLKDSYARAGIILEPDRLDWPVLLDKLKRSDFEACTLSWGGTIESDPFQIFHSSQTEGQADNRTFYINKELDKVIESARRELNDENRMKLWHEVHRILHEDQPYTFMRNAPRLVFINGRIQNVAKSKLGLNYPRLMQTPAPWFVPSGQQKHSR